MPTYTYRCPAGHLTELVQSITEDLPATVACERFIGRHDVVRFGELPPTAQPVDNRDGFQCCATAGRVYEPPAAIHYKGRGFYATDVKGAQERRRRPNVGDDLPRKHDPVAAAIARSL